ncbi:MAG: hypothetical protein R6V27_08380 [Balneolaceae bacterium]
MSSKLNGAGSSGETGKSSEISVPKNGESVSDKVSLGDYKTPRGEELFAKIELEKLNQDSFNDLKTMKSKINEYHAAGEISPEAAAETELGQLLNNPDVWGEIANKILD